MIAVHDGLDQLACAHIAESDDEADEVVRVAAGLGPVWTFPVPDDDGETFLQYWSIPEPEVHDPKRRDP